MFKILSAVSMVLVLAMVAGCSPYPDGKSEIVYSYEKDPIGLDMYNMPSMKPQQGYRGRLFTYPEGTVPRGGKELPMTRDEADGQLSNPIEMSDESVRKGRFAYVNHCATCHAIDGAGQTPVAEKLMEGGAAVPNLQFVMSYRSEGFVYATIRNGGVNMPPYGAQTTIEERWHIVNYIRSLQP